MKKKLSLVLAVIMAASMLAGCKKTDETSAGLPDIGTEALPSLTQMTTEATTTAAEVVVTTTEAATTTAPSDTEPEPEPETETTTAAPESETETVTSVAETTAAPSDKWSETELDEVFYIKENCYSRKEAVIGAETVKQYKKGQKIVVVAATDTGYYKLEDGTFIHSDYLTEERPDDVSVDVDVDVSAETTTRKPSDNITVPEDKPSGSGSKPISTSYKKSYKDRYPYKQLSSAEKELYANIVEAAESFSPSVSVPNGLSGDDVFKVYAIVFNNEPQLFWLSLRPPVALGGEMRMNYELSPDEAASVQKKIDSTVKEVMAKVAGYSGTTSKLKVIYDWVIQTNNFSLNSSIYTCGVYSSLTGGGDLQCQGYAKTVLYLCDIAGIDCMVVNGTNDHEDTHAWNVVYCDNGYYILDSTRGDPYGADYMKSNYVRYYFFLANDKMIKNSHLHISSMYKSSSNKWIKLYDPPACTKSDAYYFKAYKKEFSDYDSAMAALKKEIDDAVSAGKQVVHIRVTDHDLWEKLKTNKVGTELQKYAKSKSNKVDKIKPQTPLTEDLLVVHYDIVYK